MAASAVASLKDRITAALIACGCLALLVTGAGLTPSEAGHGTHHQMGMPPCGFLIATGKPCATCGMTTAVSRMANGDLIGAFRAQPFGAGLAVAAAVVFWGALHVALFGSGLGRAVSRSFRPWMTWVIAMLFGAAWLYKVLTWTQHA